MDNTWTYREGIDAISTELIGYDVEASDGHIGKIDELSLDAGRDYLVVDTGFWIFGKKRLVPAGVVKQINRETETVHLAMTKDEVKDAPDWDADWSEAGDSGERYSSYFRPFGW